MFAATVLDSSVQWQMLISQAAYWLHIDDVLKYSISVIKRFIC
jgi:hypothetical protein